MLQTDRAAYNRSFAWMNSQQYLTLKQLDTPGYIISNRCSCGKAHGQQCPQYPSHIHTVYPKKYAHGFVVFCFVVVMQSFIMNSHEVFIHIHQGCFAGTGAIVSLPQCQWNKPDGYGKLRQCITTTKHSKAKTVCIFLGVYCMFWIRHTKITSTSAIIPFHQQHLCLSQLSSVCNWNLWHHDEGLGALAGRLKRVLLSLASLLCHLSPVWYVAGSTGENIVQVPMPCC